MIILLQVQINIALSFLLIILLGHAYFNMNKKIITNNIFMWVMGLTCLTLVSEVFSVVLNNPNFKQFIVINKLVNLIGFIITPIIPYLGYRFTKEWINRYQKEKIKENRLLLLPLFINGILALISYNAGILFNITSENVYERGSLFFILPCVSYIYLSYNLYFIYTYRKSFTYSELIIFNMFYIVPVVFTAIQLKFPFYLTTWNSAAIIIVITYIFILNDQVNRDSLTGLGNRLSYENYTQNISIKKLNRLFVVYIDIDEFKSINDLYGHYEGDLAIKEFSNLLSDSFHLNHKKLIRLGGDEFLVLLEEQYREKVLECIQNLIKNVETYNNRSAKPYILRFSYGLASYTAVNNSIYKIVDCADQAMYKQKQSKNSYLSS